GLRDDRLKKSVEYLRANWKAAGDNAYVLALAANALAAWDAKDDSTHDVLKKLESIKKDAPESKACCFPCSGTALTYARGDAVTIETTALAALAMMKSGQFTTSVNAALTYLIKAKQGAGHWGSTSATILSLKALLAGMGGNRQDGKATFVIKVNGKEA